AAGGLFILLGFSPKLGALLSIMPAPVQGAIVVFVTCFMVMSGIADHPHVQARHQDDLRDRRGARVRSQSRHRARPLCAGAALDAAVVRFLAHARYGGRGDPQPAAPVGRGTLRRQKISARRSAARRSLIASRHAPDAADNCGGALTEQRPPVSLPRRWGWSLPEPPAMANDSYRDRRGGSPCVTRRKAGVWLLPV